MFSRFPLSSIVKVAADNVIQNDQRVELLVRHNAYINRIEFNFICTIDHWSYSDPNEARCYRCRPILFKLTQGLLMKGTLITWTVGSVHRAITGKRAGSVYSPPSRSFVIKKQRYKSKNKSRVYRSRSRPTCQAQYRQLHNGTSTSIQTVDGSLTLLFKGKGY